MIPEHATVVSVDPKDVRFILDKSGWRMGVFQSFPHRVIAWHSGSGQIKSVVLPESFELPDTNQSMDQQIESITIQMEFALLKELTGISQEIIGLSTPRRNKK